MKSLSLVICSCKRAHLTLASNQALPTAPSSSALGLLLGGVRTHCIVHRSAHSGGGFGGGCCPCSSSLGFCCCGGKKVVVGQARQYSSRSCSCCGVECGALCCRRSRFGFFSGSRSGSSGGLCLFCCALRSCQLSSPIPLVHVRRRSRRAPPKKPSRAESSKLCSRGSGRSVPCTSLSTSLCPAPRCLWSDVAYPRVRARGIKCAHPPVDGARPRRDLPSALTRRAHPVLAARVAALPAPHGRTRRSRSSGYSSGSCRVTRSSVVCCKLHFGCLRSDSRSCSCFSSSSCCC